EPTPTTPTASPTPVAVTWTKLVNASLSGTTLYKSAGCSGCGDATAISAAAIASGDGYAEFTATETGLMRSFGLSQGLGSGEVRLNYGIRLQGRYATVYEKGSYKADVPFSTGDKFRIT